MAESGSCSDAVGKDVLQDILQRETASARRAVHAFRDGQTPSLDQQVPYVDHAAHILMSSGCQLKLNIHGTTPSGNEEKWEVNMTFPTLHQDQEQETANTLHQTQLARLALYLLKTRGRLTKVKKEAVTLEIPQQLRLSQPHEYKSAKRSFLESDNVLRQEARHVGVMCGYDPEWSTRILQVMAPRVERLTLDHVGPSHLDTLATMPKLRRLNIWRADSSFATADTGPFHWTEEDVSANDPADPTRPYWIKGPPGNSGLVFLKVNLPRQIMLPLIAQHHRTLRELILDVSVPGEPDPQWEWSHHWDFHCNDLPERMAELVKRFPLESLRVLDLSRNTHSNEGHKACEKQQRALRKILGPNVLVRCKNCA